MQAWVVARNGAPLERIEKPTPIPTGTEVLVEVTHCGVCHSDLHFWEGSYDLGGGRTLLLSDRGVSLPRAIGHEILGRVAALGPEASGVAIGDRRIVYPWLGCGMCRQCRAGQDNLCLKQRSLGVMQDGGFGSHVVVPHPRYLVDPGDVDPAVAATFGCSGITVLSAIRKVMPLAPDDPVVLIGAGGLGLAAIGMLRAMGHEAIISVDISAEKRAARSSSAPPPWRTAPHRWWTVPAPTSPPPSSRPPPVRSSPPSTSSTAPPPHAAPMTHWPKADGWCRWASSAANSPSLWSA